MEFKLGFGPMSPLIIDALVSYANANSHPMMLIASRNQIDYNSGYVMNTEQFANHIKGSKTKYIKVCRDHCGPYFLDSEKHLPISQAVEATKKTIASDIENGFDLIHVDTSRCDDPYPVAEELIKFSLSLNPNIEFEFGSEENVGVLSGVKKYKKDVSFAKQFPNMKFVVAQTGSLVMEDRQVGDFNFEIVRDLANYANEAGVKLKEHNADYLTIEQLQLRKLCGVHALNIAPQLGVVQTKVLLSLAKQNNIDTRKFKNIVINSNKWGKWIIDGNDEKKVEIAGHYCIHDDKYKNITSQINNYNDRVNYSINSVLHSYYSTFH